MSYEPDFLDSLCFYPALSFALSYLGPQFF